MFKFITASLACVLTCAVMGEVKAAGNIDASNKYAWSGTAGWVNFNPAYGGVDVRSDHLRGYAWAANAGWIKLGSDSGGPYGNTNATNWGVDHDGHGTLSGFAWSPSAGWINFNPGFGQGVGIDKDGNFSGYAWSREMGWIHFSNPTGAAPYKVATSWRASVVLSFSAGNGGAISGTTPQTVAIGAASTAVTAVPNTGYHFVNWTAAGGFMSTDNPLTVANVQAAAAYTAEFAINTYTLTYTAGVNGTIIGTSPQTVIYGTSGTAVTAVPNVSYHFLKWSDGGATASRTDANVTANVSATAEFELNSYQVGFAPQPAEGGGTAPSGSVTLSHGVARPSSRLPRRTGSSRNGLPLRRTPRQSRMTRLLPRPSRLWGMRQSTRCSSRRAPHASN